MLPGTLFSDHHRKTLVQKHACWVGAMAMSGIAISFGAVPNSQNAKSQMETAARYQQSQQNCSLMQKIPLSPTQVTQNGENSVQSNEHPETDNHHPLQHGGMGTIAFLLSSGNVGL
jgi:hypothetical protein